MRFLPAIAIVLAAAFPAAAAAEPSLAPLKPCYVSSWDERAGVHSAEWAEVRGTGFTPGAEVTVLVDGASALTTTASSTGEIATQVQAPRQDEGEREFTITAVEPGGASATAPARVTALSVTARPRTASPRRRITWRGRGFTDLGRPVYAHYHRRGRLRKTVRIGLPEGPCGTFKVRRRQFPFRRPRVGMWVARFDQERVFDFDADTAYFDVRIEVVRRPRRGR